MKKIRVFLICFLTFCWCFPVNVRAASGKAGAEVTPEAWLTEKGQTLLNILSVPETKTRYLKLRHYCKEVFNQAEMPRMVMKNNWKALTPEQQAELQRLFFDYFVVTYGSVSMNYSDVSLKVTETVPSGRDWLLKTRVKIGTGTEKHIVPREKSVTSVIPDSSKNNGEIEVLFALRKNGAGYYIRDAKIEGQSMMLFLRSHLEKEYQSASSDAEKFLEKIRKRINERYRAAEELAGSEKAKHNKYRPSPAS